MCRSRLVLCGRNSGEKTTVNLGFVPIPRGSIGSTLSLIMPRPSSPDRYPVEFHQAFAAVLAKGEFSIPSTNPKKLRMHFYGFIGACRRAGNDKGDLIEVIERPDRIILRHRSKNPLALEIAAALAQQPTPEGGETGMFERLTK